MMNDKLIQSFFNKNAKKLVNVTDLYENVALEICQKLKYLKFNTDVLLELGSGTNTDSKIIAKFYDKSLILKVDFAINVIKLYTQKENFYNKLFNKKKYDICANINNLPVKNKSVDLVWSNMCLPFISNIQDVFNQVNYCLKDNGLFVASSLGPQTFIQLDALGLSRFNFIDMHDLGDALAKTGFSDIVVSSEIFNLEYSDIDTFFNDIKMSGCGAAIGDFKYLSKKRYQEIKDLLNQHIGQNMLILTIEIVYIHGWKIKQDNKNIIKFFPYKQQNKV